MKPKVGQRWIANFTEASVKRNASLIIEIKSDYSFHFQTEVVKIIWTKDKDDKIGNIIIFTESHFTDLNYDNYWSLTYLPNQDKQNGQN
jgi:hypothetical protein